MGGPFQHKIEPFIVLGYACVIIPMCTLYNENFVVLDTKKILKESILYGYLFVTINIL